MTGWLPVSPCTAVCVGQPAEPVPLAGRLRRRAALAEALTGAVADGGPSPARARQALAALGVTLELHGEPPSGPGTLFAANHVSWLDDVALLAALPGARPVAKTEIAGWPVIGGWARRSGAVFLDRSSLRRLPDAVAEVAAILRAGGSVVVHPEGTTGCGAEVGRFRPAFFEAAIRAGAPVRPVALRYRLGESATSVAGYVADLSLRHSLRRVVAASGLAIAVHRLSALPPLGNRRALAAAAHRVVAETVGTMRLSDGGHERGVAAVRPVADPVAPFRAAA